MSWKDRAEPVAANGWQSKAELLPASPATEPSADRQEEAALQGFGQGATFGFLPWLQARAEQVVKGGEQAIDGFQRVDPSTFARGLGNVAQGALSTTGLGPLVGLTPNTPEFEISRQQFDARAKGLKAQHPEITTASNIAGSIMNPVTLATGGGGMVASKGLGQAMAQGAKLGMATGAAQGAGDVASEGLQGTDALGRLAAQTGMGAVGGGIGGGAVYGLGKAAGAVRDFSTNRALAYLGGAGNAAQNRAMNTMGPDFKRQLAEDAIDSGIMGRFSGTQKMQERAGELLGKRGSALEDVYGQIDEAAPAGTNPLTFMQSLEAKSAEAAKRGIDTSSPYRQELGRQSERIAGVADELGLSDALPLRQANQLFKSPLSASKGKAMATLSLDDQARLAAQSDAYSALQKTVESEAERMAGPAQLEALRGANRSYGNAAQIEKLLGKRAQQDAGNRAFGLTDTIAAAGGMTAGPAGGAAGLLFNKLMRGAGGQALAVQGVKSGRFAQNALQTPAAGYVGSVLGADVGDPLGEMLFGSEKPKPATPPGTDPEKKAEVASGHFVGAQ